MEKRYKVLIADDEYWTREKLRNMIEWDKYHLELLEPAGDGEEVLRRMEGQRPDILITDINMPFLSGVELLKIIKEKYENVITFVISGYDDFEFVKESFMAGSINYLVKPVSKIDLVNAVAKALQIISDRDKKEEEEEMKKQELLKAASLLQDREFSHLLEYKDTPFARNRELMTSHITMNGNVDFAGSGLMLIKIHNMKKVVSDYNYDMNLISLKLKERIRETAKREERMEIDNLPSQVCACPEVEKMMVFNHIYRSNEFIIVSELDKGKMMRIARKLMTEIGELAASPVTIVISEHTYSMDSIQQAYAQAVSLLMTRGYSTDSCLIMAGGGTDGGMGKSAEVKNRMNDAQAKELQALLNSGNRNGVYHTIFEKIGIRHCQEQGWEYLEVRQTVKRILNLLVEYVQAKLSQTKSSSAKLSSRELLDMESMVEMADKSIELLDVKYLCDIMEDIIDGILTSGVEEAADSMRDVVHQAARYIQEHYFEPLTLSGLAEQFHVEHSYFSRIFKKEMGQTLMLYISGLRVEKAKEYMKGENNNLAEIAFMVGYDDYTYFNRVFRKVTGISPRDYKKSVEACE